MAAHSTYQIRFKGHLDEEWSDWFDGMEITNLEVGDVVLIGPVADQSALYGLLLKGSNLNLTLISVEIVNAGQGN
jgi:hypothetical protein